MNSLRLSAVIVLVGLLGLGLQPTAAQVTDNNAFQVTLTTPTELQFGDHYILPAGSYYLMQPLSDASVWWMFEAPDDHVPGTRPAGEPIATLNTWRVWGYNEDDNAGLESGAAASLIIKEGPYGNQLRVLEGFQINDAQWKIRDVVERDEDRFARIWDMADQ